MHAVAPVTRGPLDWLRRLIARFKPDLSSEHDAVVEELKQAYISAFAVASPNTPVSTALANRASQFALERAGELITDITEVTRDGVKELVTSAVQDGLSPQQLQAALRDYSGFGPERAETIGRTETAYALGKAARAAAEDAGHDEKSWSGGECSDCVGNEGDGWIPIDDDFSSGDNDIPAHPRCSCTVRYRTAPLYADENADTGDEEEKAARPRVVAEARCPQCRRWVGRNIPVGAEVYCPAHKAVRIEA